MLASTFAETVQNSLDYVESYLSSKELRVLARNRKTSTFKTNEVSLILEKPKNSFVENIIIQRNIDEDLKARAEHLELETEKMNQVFKIHRRELKQKHAALMQDHLESLNSSPNNELKTSGRLLIKKEISNSSENLFMLESQSPQEILKIKLGFNEKVNIQIGCLEIRIFQEKLIKYSIPDPFIRILIIQFKNISGVDIMFKNITLSTGKSFI